MKFSFRVGVPEGATKEAKYTRNLRFITQGQYKSMDLSKLSSINKRTVDSAERLRSLPIYENFTISTLHKSTNTMKHFALIESTRGALVPRGL